MAEKEKLRPGEQAVESLKDFDAGLIFIGKISTPWKERSECPRQGQLDGSICRIDLFEPWQPALAGITDYQHIEVLYWLHHSRRDLVLQSPRRDGSACGTFALRPPARPNPIGTSLVTLVEIDGPTLIVRGLDCLDGTPVIDIKPDRCRFTSPALPGHGGTII